MEFKPNAFVNAYLLQSYAHPKGCKQAKGNVPVTDFINVACQRLARANAIFIGEARLNSLLVQMVNGLEDEGAMDEFPATGVEVSVEDVIPKEHKELFELQMLEGDEDDPEGPLFPWDGFKQVCHEIHTQLVSRVYRSESYDFRLLPLEDDTKNALLKLRLVLATQSMEGNENALS